MPFPPMTFHSCTLLRRGAWLADAHSGGSFDLSFQADTILSRLNQSDAEEKKEVMVFPQNLFFAKRVVAHKREVGYFGFTTVQGGS